MPVSSWIKVVKYRDTISASYESAMEMEEEHSDEFCKT